MKSLTRIALAFQKDEPCYGLSEQSLIMAFSDGSRQRRWVQKVKVVRGDALAEFTTDYGPAEDYEHIPPLFIPSFGDDSVAQLQELAENHRHDMRWEKRRKELQAESTLIKDILQREEEGREWVVNRSHFGPKLSVQRNTNIAKPRKPKGVF